MFQEQGLRSRQSVESPGLAVPDPAPGAAYLTDPETLAVPFDPNFVDRPPGPFRCNDIDGFEGEKIFSPGREIMLAKDSQLKQSPSLAPHGTTEISTTVLATLARR